LDLCEIDEVKNRENSSSLSQRDGELLFFDVLPIGIYARPPEEREESQYCG